MKMTPIHWMLIGFSFVLTWGASIGFTNPPSEQELKMMKEEWDECCKNNVCIQNSCYTTEMGASGWAAVRQRCQSKYPDWPFAVDIFSIQNQKDIETLSNNFQKGLDYSEAFPITMWTSGTRCPLTSSEGPVLQTRWTSSKSPFPDWLENKTNPSSSDIPDENEGCKFLVIYPAPNNSDTKYDFQDQTARHAAICEFLLPEELTDNTQNDGLNVSEDTTQSYSETFDPKTSSVYNKKTTLMNNTMETTGEIDETSEHTTKSTYLRTQSTVQLTSDLSLTKTSSHINMFSSSTTNMNRFCREKTAAGIHWPIAAPGDTVKQKCPDKMTGYAQWKCDEVTLQYTPDTPHILDCKHVWIKSLEEDVDKGTNATTISHKLADATGKQALTHGDITALVDLSIKLLGLYIKQTGDHLEQQDSYTFTEHMVSSMSNILRTKRKTAWESLPQIHQTREASNILKLVANMGSRLSCVKRSSNELQFTIAAENIGLQTFLLNDSSLTSDDELMVFPKRVPDMDANSSISLPSYLQLDKWYSPCAHFKTAVGVLYNQVGDFLKDENVSNYSPIVATPVISFALSNNTESILLPKDQNVTVILEHTLLKNITKKLLRNPRCMFWNFSKQTYGQWDSSGCHRLYSNLTHTVCTCNHLTNFAVLMDFNNNIKKDKILTLMTYICCGASSVALVITLICLITIKSLHGRRNIITGNLCFSLLITNMLIIFGLDQTQNKVLCSTIAGLLHFWILSSFFWMLVEGYHLYKMVILVFQRASNWSVKFYYLFAYGAPILIVGISASIRSDGYGGNQYGCVFLPKRWIGWLTNQFSVSAIHRQRNCHRRKTCWLSEGLRWSFIGPACAIILVNSVVFFLTLWSASNVRIKREQATIRKIKNWARGSMSVMCLVGVTWCLGLLYFNEQLYVFSYIFIVTNGLQGVFIFIFHILFNDKVNSIFLKKLKRKKQEQWKKFPIQTISNRLHSKTSTQTSAHSNGCKASEFNLRRMSTGITFISNSSQSRDMRNGSNHNRNNLDSGSNISNRKRKAMHKMSENEQSPFSEQCGVSPKTFSDEPKNKFQRNSLNSNKVNDHKKPSENNSTSR